MPIQKIPLEALHKIRQHIKSNLVLPKAENYPRSRFSLDDEHELPEPDSLSDLGDLFNFGGTAELETYAPNAEGNWFVSSMNPGMALMKLPGLKLKPGLRLVTYLYRTTDEGVGATWAVPERLSITAQLERVLTDSANPMKPPYPEGALADVMEGIEGDRSAMSFMIASILHRELREFGALGKFQDWFHHRLINALPTQLKWQWRITPPKDLFPKVLIYPDNRAAIEFFTCRVTAPIAIFQHVDQYSAACYKPSSRSRVIAVPQRN